MGLAERRVTQEFQTNELPKLQEAIDHAAGSKLPVEIHWDQLTPEGESRLYVESWKAIYFEPLIAALKSVGKDQMGRDAMQAIKNVVIQNTKGNDRPDDWAAQRQRWLYGKANAIFARLKKTVSARFF